MRKSQKNIDTYLVYRSCEFTGLMIIGLYCNYRSAIRVAMRKVYQLMDVNTRKIEGEWTWIDDSSCISIMTLPIIDVRDIKSESPIPQFFRYQKFLNDIPIEDLEKFRMQAINKKKLMDKIKKIKN